jgi:hypothetical protein
MMVANLSTAITIIARLTVTHVESEIGFSIVNFTRFGSKLRGTLELL